VIDYVNYWSDKTEIGATLLVNWLGISHSKFYDWKERYGKVNEHNSWIPRDHWLEEWEKQAIVTFHFDHPLDGYRCLTYMMIDSDVVYVSPSSVYRVLKKAGLLERWSRSPTKKGTGFEQPLGPHQHWHADIMYVNICGTFYYLCTVLDGYSRYIVHWEIRESMTEQDVEIVVQRALEKYPKERPRIISDNGPQFIAKDFKEFIRLSGMSHVKTSPYYPQSNGKIERWHQSLKKECIRPGSPLSLEDARRIIGKYVEEYNNVRLHSAIDYIAPRDKLEGRAKKILAERDRKLEEARERRKRNRKTLTKGEVECENIYQSVKRKRAMLGSNSSGIADREGDKILPRGGSQIVLSPHPNNILEPLPYALKNPDSAEQGHHKNSKRRLSISR